MSVMSLLAAEFELMGRFLRGAGRASGKAMEVVGATAPLARLALAVPEQAATVARFKRARLLATHGQSQLILQEFDLATKELLALAGKADAETAALIRREVKAATAFVALRSVPDVAGFAARTGGRALQEADIVLLRSFTNAIMTMEGPFAAETQGVLRRILARVGPADEAAWSEILGNAREFANRMRSGLLEDALENRAVLQAAMGGRISNVQGPLFEAYGRAFLREMGEIGRMLRKAARRCGVNGPGWEPLHVNGEIMLARLDEAQLAAALRGEDVLSKLPFAKHADDGVLALGPAGKGRLRECDATAMMEFKGEASHSGLAEKIEALYGRLLGGKNGPAAVFLQFRGPDGREVTALLRPPRSGADLTFYAIGTDGTVIGDASALKAAGVTQRRIVTDINRDEVRLFAEDLIFMAVVLFK